MVKSSILLFVHVHYPDIWGEISALLEDRIRRSFRLVVTSSHPEEMIPPPQTPHLLSFRFLPTENRGRDIRPFLQAMEAAGDFELGLKLHTKKSPQRADGPQWRGEVMTSLLPSAEGVEAIVAGMEADPRIGFVTPGGFALSVRPWVLVNAPGMERVMGELGHALAVEDMEDAYFAAGSMFWFRRQALSALASEPILNLFEPEEGQLDGTIAHAMERLFPVEARRQGFLSLSVPALLASHPDMPEDALRALARAHADRPSTYFPAPYVAALPPGTPMEPLPTRGGRALLRAVYHRLPVGLRLALRRALLRGHGAPR